MPRRADSEVTFPTGLQEGKAVTMSNGHKVAKFTSAKFGRTSTLAVLVGPEVTLEQMAELQIIRDSLNRKRINLYLVVHTIEGVSRDSADLVAYFYIPFKVEGHDGEPVLLRLGEMEFAYLDTEFPNGVEIGDLLDEDALHELSAFRRVIKLKLNAELFGGEERLQCAAEGLAEIFESFKEERARQFDEDSEYEDYEVATRPLTLEMKIQAIWDLQQRFKRIN